MTPRARNGRQSSSLRRRPCRPTPLRFSGGIEARGRVGTAIVEGREGSVGKCWRRRLPGDLFVVLSMGRRRHDVFFLPPQSPRCCAGLPIALGSAGSANCFVGARRDEAHRALAKTRSKGPTFFFSAGQGLDQRAKKLGPSPPVAWPAVDTMRQCFLPLVKGPGSR